MSISLGAEILYRCDCLRTSAIFTCRCLLSRSISNSFCSICFRSSAALVTARLRFDSFSCKNLLNLISESCSSTSFFRRASSRRRNASSCLKYSSFCASRASWTSNICRRFSSSRVAGETCEPVRFPQKLLEWTGRWKGMRDRVRASVEAPCPAALIYY